MAGETGASLVEGSTSLLDWSLKGALLRALPAWDPLRMAGWLGLAWLVLGVTVAALAGARWSGSKVVGAGVGCLVALSPGLTESAAYLLEGPLFACLWLLALVAAAERRLWRCWVWSLLLAAARPEGLALAPCLMAWAGRGEVRGEPVRWRKSVAWAAAGALAAGIVTLTRHAVYGDWLPNTYYAKSSGSRWLEFQDGLRYVLDVLWQGSSPTAAALALGAAVLIVIGRSWRGSSFELGGAECRGTAVGLLAFAGLYAAGVIWSGGDSYLGARLFMPIGLATWLALGASLRGATSTVTALALAVPSMALVAPFFGDSGSLHSVPLQKVLPRTVDALSAGPVGMEAFAGDREVFAEIADALGPHGVFAHLHTQRYRWFQPNAPVLDLTGLTDREVARRPAEGPVRFGRAAVALALEREVGAIHLDPLRGRASALVDALDLAGALSDPGVAGRYLGEPYLESALAQRLASDYVAASRRLPDGAGYFNLLVRRDMADSFRAKGFRLGHG